MCPRDYTGDIKYAAFLLNNIKLRLELNVLDIHKVIFYLDLSPLHLQAFLSILWLEQESAHYSALGHWLKQQPWLLCCFTYRGYSRDLERSTRKAVSAIFRYVHGMRIGNLIMMKGTLVYQTKV